MNSTLLSPQVSLHFLLSRLRVWNGLIANRQCSLHQLLFISPPLTDQVCKTTWVLFRVPASMSPELVVISYDPQCTINRVNTDLPQSRAARGESIQNHSTKCKQETCAYNCFQVCFSDSNIFHAGKKTNKPESTYVKHWMVQMYTRKQP